MIWGKFTFLFNFCVHSYAKSHDCTVTGFTAVLFFHLFLILVQLLHKPSIRADMFAQAFYLFQSFVGLDFSQFHQVCCYNCGAAWDAGLAMHVHVGFGDVLLDELIGTAEETLDVLSGVVWDENTEVFDVGVDKKIFFTKNRDNGTNL